MDANMFYIIVLVYLTVIFLLVLGILLLMVSLFRQQQERIAKLEALMARGQPAPAFVDGQKPMLTKIDGFVDRLGNVRLNNHQLSDEFSGFQICAYIVAEG